MAGVVEIADRAPFERQQQVGPAVAVDIGPGRGGDHADVAQPGREHVRDIDEFAADIAIQETARDLGAVPGDDASADKDVEFAVAVEISGRDRAGAFPVGGQRAGGSGREVAAAVVEIQTVVEQGVADPVFDPAGGDEEVGMPVAVDVEKHRADVVGLGRVGPGLVGGRDEPAIGPAEKEPASLTAGTGDEQIVDAVAVDVSHRERGTHAVQAAGQEALAAEFVKGALLAEVLESVRSGGLGEERVRIGGRP